VCSVSHLQHLHKLHKVETQALLLPLKLTRVLRQARSRLSVGPSRSWAKGCVASSVVIL